MQDISSHKAFFTAYFERFSATPFSLGAASPPLIVFRILTEYNQGPVQKNLSAN
jgi:hypothetical protein